jgi:glycosyltransferase involved in cell wall biosynthesis
MSKAGADIELVTNDCYELETLDHSFPVRKIFHRARFYPRDIIRFWREFRREKPSIVHYQAYLKFPAIELILLELQKRAGTRLVYTAHDWLPHRRRRYHPHLFRRFYRQFDRIIVHSDRGSRFLVEELGVDSGKVSVIPHGDYGFFATDRKLTREKARKRLGLDPETTWFLFFGHIEEYKGLDVALKALGHLKREDGDGRKAGLIIAGRPGGEGFSSYDRIIGEQDLAGQLSLNLKHIPVSDIQLYFRAADVLLLPYHESSTSGLVHVAMGFGLPVVASDVGSLAVMVEQAGAGTIVEPNDDVGLATAMAELVRDETKRQRLGKAWDDIGEQYSWDNIAAETLAVYRSLLDR